MTRLLTRSRFAQVVRARRMDARRRRLARRALGAAYSTFAGHNPRWTQSLFDRHLLEVRIASLLEEALRGGAPLTACALATAWAGQLTRDEGKLRRLATQALPTSEAFLALLETSLRSLGGSSPEPLLEALAR